MATLDPNIGTALSDQILTERLRRFSDTHKTLLLGATMIAPTPDMVAPRFYAQGRPLWQASAHLEAQMILNHKDAIEFLVGNADEIVRWTGGGMLCEASKDDRGYTRVDPQVLSLAMARCMKRRDWLQQLGTTARGRFRKHFTWSVVAGYYEAILFGRNPDVRIEDDGPLGYGLERASGVT